MAKNIEKPILITYDLRGESKDYKGLISAIEEFSTCFKITESSWIIFSSLTDEQVFNKLRVFIDSDDRIVIAILEGYASGSNPISNVDKLNEELKNYLQNKE